MEKVQGNIIERGDIILDASEETHSFMHVVNFFGQMH